MNNKDYYINDNGIKVRKRCMGCAFHVVKDSKSCLCTKESIEVSRYAVCDEWMPYPPIVAAGGSEGEFKVKDIRYHFWYAANTELGESLGPNRYEIWKVKYRSNEKKK